MDPIRRRESVCRSLFGPVDHEQLRRELKLKLKEISEQDSRRWNFNFQSETPLPGRFQWEEIPTDRVATLYQDSTQLKDVVCSPATEDVDRLGEQSTGTDQENCSSISNTLKCPTEVTPVRRKRTRSKPAAKPNKNARITGEQQALLTTLHFDPITKNNEWMNLFFFFFGRFFCKEAEDNRNKERSELFSHNRNCSVQNNQMSMLLRHLPHEFQWTGTRPIHHTKELYFLVLFDLI